MELQRAMGVHYRCALAIGHKIRQCFIDREPIKLSGTVQVDETLVGGYRPGKRGWAAEGKTCILGMIEPGGRVKTLPVPDRKRKTLLPILKLHIEKGSKVFTDEFKVYLVLKSKGYKHGTVNHSKYQWVNGEASTNCMEGYWSNLKKAILGTHTQVSDNHRTKYLAEFDFRHNHRKGFVMFDEMLKRLVASRPPEPAAAPSPTSQRNPNSHA